MKLIHRETSETIRREEKPYKCKVKVKGSVSVQHNEKLSYWDPTSVNWETGLRCSD